MDVGIGVPEGLGVKDGAPVATGVVVGLGVVVGVGEPDILKLHTLILGFPDSLWVVQLAKVVVLALKA